MVNEPTSPVLSGQFSGLKDPKPSVDKPIELLDVSKPIAPIEVQGIKHSSEPEEMRIPVVDADGNLGSIPQSQVEDAVFKDKAFTLAPVSPIKDTDLDKEGRLKIVTKDGVAGTIDRPKTLSELDNILKEGDWTLQSKYDIYQNPEVQKNIELIKKSDDFERAGQLSADRPSSELSGNESSRELRRTHRNIFTVDQNHNFTMINDKGHELSVPVEQISDARAAGYNFIDPKFENLYNAYVFVHKDSQNQVNWQAANQALSTGISDIPIVGQAFNYMAKNQITDPVGMDSVMRANALASNSSEIKQAYQSARAVGTVASLGAQLLAPEGLLGEVAAASKVGKAVKAAKVLEDSPILASALSHAAQGATIAAPQAADALIKNNPKLAAESLGLGILGGVVLGELPGLIGAANKKIGQVVGAEAQADKILSSLGGGEAASAGILKLEGQTKDKILNTLSEAGLKETANADKAFQVLNEVSGGSKISVLDKLESSSEKILTSPLKAEIGSLTQTVSSRALAGGGLAPELEGAIVNLQNKLEKIIPEGEVSLTQVQKLSTELSESLGKISNSEAKALTLQARELVMQELFKTADVAASKANVATAAAWMEQKGIAEAAGLLRGGLEAQVSAAEKLAAETSSKIAEVSTKSNELADKVVKGGISKLFAAPQVAGSALGHAILPGVGGWIGGKLGEKVGEALESKFGGKIMDTVKPFLDKILPSSGGRNWIIKNAENPNISSYLAMNAIHHTGQSLSQIPDFIKNPVIKSALFAINPDPIKNLLGTQANGLSKAQQFDRLSDKISMLAGNEQLRNQYLDSLSQTMASNHPELKEGLKAELNNKIQAVNSLLHAGNTAEPLAFQKQSKYVPSKDQMAKIEAGLNAIENPYVVLSGLHTGKVSSQQVSLIKQIYPAIYQEMVGKINQEAFGGKSTLNYQQRLSASMITGQPMDQSLRNGSALQASFAPAPQGAAPRRQGNSKPLKSSKIASYTTSQRVAAI